MLKSVFELSDFKKNVLEKKFVSKFPVSVILLDGCTDIAFELF